VYSRVRTASAEPKPISLNAGKCRAWASDADTALATSTSGSKTQLLRDGEVRGSPLRSRSPSPSAGWMSCTVSNCECVLVNSSSLHYHFSASHCDTPRQARAQTSASFAPRTRRGLFSTTATCTPLLPSTQPVSTQKILKPRAESAAGAAEREKAHMQSVMHGTRQAGALAAVCTFHCDQLIIPCSTALTWLPQEFLRLKTSNAAVNEMLM
jgi:hypothetical protein